MKKNKMTNQLFLLFFTLILVGMLSSCQQSPPPFECTDSIGCVEIAPGEPIRIGVLQALDATIYPGGTVQVRSIELAVSQRNGQIFDHPIELQIEDSGCSAEGGALAALKIVADTQIVGALGTTCSAAAIPAAKTISEAGLVMISGLNTAPSLTESGGLPGENWQPGYYRTIANGTQIAAAMATFAFQELGITRVASLGDGGIYAQELADEFSAAFTDLDGEIVFSGIINKGDTNMEPILTAVSASGAKALYFPVFQPEAVLIIRQTKMMAEFEDITLLGGEPLGSGEFIDAIGLDGIGLYISSPETPAGSALDQIEFAYEEKFGAFPQHHGFPYAYDATNLLFHAIEEVAFQASDGTLFIGRAALRDELYATTDFDGITGQLSCSEFGDCSAIQFAILRLDDPSLGIEGLLSNVVYSFAPGQ